MKKYYYMRLKEDFFDSESIVLLEAMQDGYMYSNILLKLYLKSLKNEGRLIFNGCIPYNSQMIATLTRHGVGVVEKALTLFQQLGLIEVLDNGAIYMLDIQNYIGKSNTESERKKDYRRRIKTEKQSLSECGDICPTVPDICPDICPTEIDIDIEKDIDIDIDIDIETEKEKNKEGAKTSRFRPPSLEEVEDYCRERGNNVDAEAFVDFYASKNWMVGKNKMSDWKAAVRTWEKRENERAVERHKNKNNAHEAVMDWLAWSEANEGSGCFDWVGGEEE